MKSRGILAVLVLSVASLVAQDASKPADHAACKRDKDGKMACCKKDKDGKMSQKMDCCKKGKCDQEKKSSGTENKS